MHSTVCAAVHVSNSCDLTPCEQARCGRHTALVHVSMPCINCARAESGFGIGVTSTSSRLDPVAPLHRVPSSHKQLQHQIQRSRVTFARVSRLCQPYLPRQLQQVDAATQPKHIQQCMEAQATKTYSSQCFGRCILQGFAAAAVLSLLAPGPSYSAESLPIGLLKNWVVSDACCILC